MLPFAWKYVSMPGRSCRYDLSHSTSVEREIEANLRTHVDKLALGIGERHKALPHTLTLTREYVGERFSASGRSVEEHAFASGVNLVAGSGDTVVGAHFDTIAGCRGANDNASGVAVMLELARLTANPRIRFVAFDNEEHQGEPATAMGSYCYAQRCRQRAEKIAGMWSLETLGFYSEEPQSQHYPDPFDLFYPTTGNFVAFVGNDASRAWVRRSVGAFRALRAFPSEGVAAPSKFNDVSRSDHWGFWQAGYPALMVTDTANFRYRPYHTADDTPDKVNFPALARVTRVLHETLSALSV